MTFTDQHEAQEEFNRWVTARIEAGFTYLARSDGEGKNWTEKIASAHAILHPS